MKHIKTYRLFESELTLTPEQKKWLDQCSSQRAGGIRPSKWTIDSEGRIDLDNDFYAVGSSFDISGNRRLKSLMGIKFGKVGGSFMIGNNNLTSLEGSPYDVGQAFYCNGNILESLEGGPKRVGLHFLCKENPELESLKGAPLEVGYSKTYDVGDTNPTVFDCSLCNLKDLEGSPEYIPGDFKCDGNPLVSLKGGPKVVERNFTCRSGRGDLESLDGAPERVGGVFMCNDFRVDKGMWGTQEGYIKLYLHVNDGFCQIHSTPERIRELILPYITEDLLDSHMKANPLDLDLLDNFPDIKAGVLKRTGLKDTSVLARAMRGKMI
jgi:hypothetical protein